MWFNKKLFIHKHFDLNLIKIKKAEKNTDFSSLLEKLRANSTDEISLEEITNEVEQVKKLRYEK